MAPQTPTGVPADLVAGDSWRWRIADLADYPQSEGWSLLYELLGIGTLSLTGAWQASGDDADHWLITAAPDVTGPLPAGRYRLIGRMVGSGTYVGREETVSNTVLVVQPDPRAAAAGDFQTHEEAMLAAIEARMEGRLTDDIEQYGAAGRTVMRIPFEQLVKLRARYAAAVRGQRTGRFGESVAVTFGAP